MTFCKSSPAKEPRLNNGLGGPVVNDLCKSKDGWALGSGFAEVGFAEAGFAGDVDGLGVGAGTVCAAL